VCGEALERFEAAGSYKPRELSAQRRLIEMVDAIMLAAAVCS
jgi:hypothetical protein